jgi:hypothetical protein
MNSVATDAAAMSWRECVNLSDLTEDELADLAINGRLDFEGADIDHYLVMMPDGRLSIRASLGDDIRAAMARGDINRSGNLKHVLLRFMQIYTARAA